MKRDVDFKLLKMYYYHFCIVAVYNFIVTVFIIFCIEKHKDVVYSLSAVVFSAMGFFLLEAERDFTC